MASQSHRVEVELSQDVIEAIATRAAELVAARYSPSDDRWLNTREAAAHLGLSVDSVHKLTAARAIPFSQDTPGGKLWFLRSKLDAWRGEAR